MEMILVIATIILIVIQIRISSSLTAIRGAFERLEVMLAKLAADTAAIRKQGEGEAVPVPKGEVQTAAATPAHAAETQADGVLPPAPTGHPPSQRGAVFVEGAAGHPPSRRGEDFVEGAAGYPPSRRGVNVGENAVVNPPSRRGVNVGENAVVNPPSRRGVDVGENAVVNPPSRRVVDFVEGVAAHPPSERGVAQRAGGSTSGTQEADRAIPTALAPAAWTGRAAQEEIKPEEPTKLEQWAHAAWDWLRVGEEWRPGWIPGEYAVAAVQLLRAAALLLLFGAAWFVRYVHEQGWFSPTGRVIAGFLCAAALVIAGSRLLRRQWRPLGIVLAGLGFALGEFIDWAGANLYEVLPASGAFAIAAVLALGAGAMAWRHTSLLLGLVALFAGYTAPWFFPEAVRGGDAALLAWLLLLAAEGAALALTRGWRCLPWITLVATVALSAPVFAPDRLDALGRGWSLVFVALFTVFAWAESLGHALRNRRAPFWFDLAAWAAATAAAAVAATCAASPWPLFTNGLPALVLAVGSLALAYAFKTRDGGDRATLEWIFAVFSALALAFVCLSFNGTPRCALLCAAAVGFVLFAARRGSVIQACYAILAWMLWMCYVGTPASAAERIGRIGPAVASLWASGLLLRRMKTEASRFTSAFLWIAWAASLVWGTWEVNHACPEFAPSIALYWGVHALATLIVGLLFQRRDVRGAALCLFAAAAGKFLFVDQAGAPTPERVAGFLGVGLLLLLGSAGYIRAASQRRGDAANDEPRKRGNDGAPSAQ